MNHSLTLLSSFSNTLKLVSVKPYPLDDQFSFEPVSSETQLLPNQKVQVCAPCMGHEMYPSVVFITFSCNNHTGLQFATSSYP